MTSPGRQLLVDRAQPFREGINRLLGSPYLLILLGLMTAASLWPFRGAVVFEGFLFIKPHLPSLIYYGLFFVCGYVFHHHRCILLTFRKYWLQNLLLAAVLFPLALYVTGLDIAQPEQSLHTVAVLLHGLCTWALIYAFMGLFLRYLDYASPWILYVSQSSYWVYLVHLPVISFAAWWMLPYDLPAVAKFACIVTFTSFVCVVTYHYLVQSSWISSLLNGKRFNLDWPWRTPSTSPRQSAASFVGDS